MLMQDYAEEARLLIQDIDTALSMSSNVLSPRLIIFPFFIILLLIVHMSGTIYVLANYNGIL